MLPQCCLVATPMLLLLANLSSTVTLLEIDLVTASFMLPQCCYDASPTLPQCYPNATLLLPPMLLLHANLSITTSLIEIDLVTASSVTVKTGVGILCSNTGLGRPTRQLSCCSSYISNPEVPTTCRIDCLLRGHVQCSNCWSYGLSLDCLVVHAAVLRAEALPNDFENIDIMGLRHETSILTTLHVVAWPSLHSWPLPLVHKTHQWF